MIHKIVVCMLFFLISMPVFGMYTGENILEKETMANNQFIVQYKEGKDPASLSALVQKRMQMKQSALGTIKLYFSDLSYPNTPEKQLTQIRSMDKKVGYISRETLDDKNNSYLLTVTSKTDILSTIKQYKKLPNVESAQPNYYYYMMAL